MRRVLIIILAGAILISLFEWTLFFWLNNYEVSQYQEANKSYQEYKTLFSGPVFLGFVDFLAGVWRLLQRNHEAILAAFTIGIFLVTAALAGYTKKLWGSTNELVQKSGDTAQRQLRAYVFVESVTILNVANPIVIEGNPPIKPTGAAVGYPKDGPLAILTIKNTGQTPAYVVIHWGQMLFREFPLTGNLPGKQEGFFMTKSSIAPGGITNKNVRLPHPLSEEEITRLRNGTGAIYVFGDISYKDAFGVDRITNFRFMHGTMTGAIGVSTDMTICGEGNDAT